MKGLLTKDFALFLQRKKTFLFLAVWAVVMCFTMDDGSFMIGWMTVITSFFAVSSLTYDEYDNCYPFLMTLPINGKIYAMEKYLFGFICGLGGWLFSAVVYFAFAAAKGIPDLGTELMQVSVFIPACMLLIDFSLPINIKYGTEKGRMAMLILWGIVFVGIFAVDKVFHVELEIDRTMISAPVLIPAVFGLAAVLTAVSMNISINTMEKKEF